MKRQETYFLTIISLYINYFFQGIATIIIAQNLSLFEESWQASLSQVSLVMSAIGLGRILSINLAGWISDRLGRRLTVLLGIGSYVLFFLGVGYAPHYLLAFFFALFAGVGNSFLDTSTYPVVVEAVGNPAQTGALSVLNKAFISMGQFLLPILIRFLLAEGHDLGWSFVGAAVCLVLNALVLFKLPFPPSRPIVIREADGEKATRKAVHPRFYRQPEGVALLVFSFVSVSLFNTYITWIPSFAQEALEMEAADSLVWVSAYSLFSFISVFMTSYIVKQGVRLPLYMLLCTSLTGGAMSVLLLAPSLLTFFVATFVIGFFAAGGIWQLGLTLLLELFPYRRGMLTSYYSLATSLAVMLVPYLTGVLAEQHLSYVFVLIMVLAFVGTACLGLVHFRCAKAGQSHY